MSDQSSTQKTAASGIGKLSLWLVMLVSATLIAGVGWWWTRSVSPVDFSSQTQWGLNLEQPDVLIETQSLSRLPRDLLRVPVLRDSLTEDFVFYYEVNGDRLGLVGSLRRLIYEHDLQLQDSLIDELLDQPAQVAMWKGQDGRLKHFVLMLKRGGLARLLEPLAKVAANDQQLQKMGHLPLAGSEVALYRLSYNANKALLFASHGDTLLVISSPGVLFDGESQGAILGEQATEQMQGLLTGEVRFADTFELAPDPHIQHRLSVSTRALALGYQRFIPAFGALRFDMNEQGWNSFLALQGGYQESSLAFTPLWQSVPMGASLCVALPVDYGFSQRILQKLGADAVDELEQQLQGPGGLCWYPDSQLYTPLLVGALNESAQAATDTQLSQLFARVIGAHEANSAEAVLPVKEQPRANGILWQREVSSAFGLHAADQSARPEALSANAFYRVSLARQGQKLLFSLDDRLLGKGLQTLDKRFPPLADVLPAQVLVPLYLSPAGLADLLEREALGSLPADMEPVFRNAAQSLLLPKLRALAKHRGYALTLPAGTELRREWQWVPIQWQAL